MGVAMFLPKIISSIYNLNEYFIKYLVLSINQLIGSSCIDDSINIIEMYSDDERFRIFHRILVKFMIEINVLKIHKVL